MLEFTAPKPLAQNGERVSKDRETETKERGEKIEQTKLWVGGCFTSTSLRYFSLWRQIPIFQACSGEPGPCLSIHQSLKRRLLESHGEGRQALCSPLISPFHPSFLSSLMNTSLLWWTGRLGWGRGQACSQPRTWLEAETGRGRGCPVVLTIIWAAHRFVANPLLPLTKFVNVFFFFF